MLLIFVSVYDAFWALVEVALPGVVVAQLFGDWIVAFRLSSGKPGQVIRRWES
jgi:hypothetical protein